MREVWARAENGRLIASTAMDAETLAQVEGESFRCVLTQPKGRSLSQLALYWIMCTLIADNLEHDPPVTKELVSDVLKIESGHCDPVGLPDGTYKLQPRSIAFNKMRPEAFGVFLDRAFACAALKFGPALAQAARQELDRIIHDDLKPRAK